MVNIETMMMGVNSKERPIIKFEVWWQTPLGLLDAGSRELAIERLKEADMPASCMRPVSVAVGEDGIYEIIGGL